MLERLRARVQARYADIADVTGIDIGASPASGTQAIRVHLRHPDALRSLPDSLRLPTMLETVPVIPDLGDYRASAATQPFEHQLRCPAVMAGLSCGRHGCAAGTIGAIVVEEESGRPCLLSAWHVLSGSHGRPGDQILQPSSIDGGRHDLDAVAVLATGFLDADGDAAIAQLTARRGWIPLVFGSFERLDSVRRARQGETLSASTRSAGLVHARVDGIGEYRIRAQATETGDSSVWMRGLRLALGSGAAPAAGNSGAVWSGASDRAAIGLQAAADESRSTAIAGHMPAIARRLGIRLAGMEDLLDELEAATSAPDPGPVGTALTAGRPEPGGDWPRPPEGLIRPPGGGLSVATGPLEGVPALADQIWSDLRCALASQGYRGVVSAPLDAVLAHYFAGHSVAEALSSAVAAAPRFRADGITPTKEAFATAETFSHAVAVVMRGYWEKGLQ